jgi:hypothetical protein
MLGFVSHYDGSSWSASYAPSWFTGVWGLSATDIVAVGYNRDHRWGVIRRYDGASLSPMVSGAMHYLHDVWGDGQGDVFVVGESGTVLRHRGPL